MTGEDSEDKTKVVGMGFTAILPPPKPSGLILDSTGKPITK